MKPNVIIIETENDFFEKLKELQKLLNLSLVRESDFLGIEQLQFDAILISGNTKEKTPFDYLKILRENYPITPIFLLLENTNHAEIILGYEIGMSGIIVLPKPIDRINAKILAEIKKTNSLLSYKTNQKSSFSLDENLMEVKLNDTSYPLTPIEYQLLKILQAQKNNLVKKEALIKEIWPQNTHSEGALNTHFYNLKKKIPELDKLLSTKKRVGYILKIPELIEITILPTIKPSKILIVDDDLEILDILAEILIEEFRTIYTADSAKKALEIINNEKIDLILLDLYMAPEDGFTFIKKLYEKTIKIPIIICSGYSSEQNKKKAKTLGVQSFISKPFDNHELIQSVGMFLRS